MNTAARLGFELSFHGRQVRGDRWQPGDSRGEALLLHGGGKSSSAGLAPLREFLFSRGIASTAFDFIGHGRSEGTLIGSSLAERSAVLDLVIKSQALVPSKMTVIGFSMGGHIAARAAQRHGFAALGLVIAAAYGAGTESLAFGPAFANAIRQEGSWRDSEAFDAVASFKGRVQIISAECDAVVPAEIQQRYFGAAAANCAHRHHEIVTGSPHDLSAHWEIHPEVQGRVYELLAQAILDIRPVPHEALP